jgi:hypothetical protein
MAAAMAAKTPVMVAEGGEGIDGNVDYDRDDLTISEEDALAAYRAMIAASPEVIPAPVTSNLTK